MKTKNMKRTACSGLHRSVPVGSFGALRHLGLRAACGGLHRSVPADSFGALRPLTPA